MTRGSISPHDGSRHGGCVARNGIACGVGVAVSVVCSAYLKLTNGDRLGVVGDDCGDGVYSNDDDAVADGFTVER